MATVITVQADSPEECAAELEWQCAHRGAAPTLPPMLPAGGARWMARAAIVQPEAEHD